MSVPAEQMDDLSSGLIDRSRSFVSPNASAGFIDRSQKSAPTQADILKFIDQKADEYKVPRPLAHGIAKTENAKYDNSAVSPAGAIGLFQIMPGTAKDLGIDPSDWKQNIDGGLKYFSQMSKRYGGDYPKALAAYNAGPGNIDKGIMPAETRSYVPKVLQHALGFMDRTVPAANAEEVTPTKSADPVEQWALGNQSSQQSSPAQSDPVEQWALGNESATPAATSQEPVNIGPQTAEAATSVKPLGDGSTFSLPEAALSVGAGAIAAPVSGYMGLKAFQDSRAAGKSMQESLEDARSKIEDVQKSWAIHPNEATQEALASPKNPMNWLSIAGKKAGETAQDLGAPPAVAAGIEAATQVAPMFLGMRGAASRVGAITDPAAVADTINNAVKPSGMTVADVSPDFKAKVANDLSQGGTVRSDVLRAQAEADSIGTRLTEGQATGDPMIYAHEIESSKRPGGEPYRQAFGQQQEALKSYLGDKLGADTAMSPAEAGQSAIDALAKADKQISDVVGNAYKQVKNSAGRSAGLDVEDFYTKAQSALERDNATAFIPDKIARLYDDITDGKLPLTVDTMSSLDKILSRAQRTLTDGNERHAVGVIRSALNDTNISSDAGAQAVAAYKQARALARSQFELSDPKSQNYIPAYDAMLKGMGNASHGEFISALENGTANVDAASWFKNNVMNAAPAGLKKLTGFLKSAGSGDSLTALHQGALKSIQDQVVKGSSETGRTIFSSDALGKLLDNRRLTLEQVLPNETMQGLQRLSNTAARINRVPKGSPVNFSNTSSALENMGQLKGAASAAIDHAISRVPVVGKPAVFLKDIITGARKAKSETAAAQKGASPSVTTPNPSKPGMSGLRKGISLGALLSPGSQQDEPLPP